MDKEKSPFEIFLMERPDVVEAHEELAKRINKNNALDKKTLELIFVGIYSTIREPGSLRHHISEALKAGATKEEVEAAALLSFSLGVSSAELSLPIIVDLAKKNLK